MMFPRISTLHGRPSYWYRVPILDFEGAAVPEPILEAEPVSLHFLFMYISVPFLFLVLYFVPGWFLKFLCSICSQVWFRFLEPDLPQTIFL